MNIALGLLAGKLLCMERKLVLECGKSWWQLQFASYCSLALLVLPTVILAPREAIRAVPPSIREGSLALGATMLARRFNVDLPTAEGSQKTARASHSFPTLCWNRCFSGYGKFTVGTYGSGTPSFSNDSNFEV